MQRSFDCKDVDFQTELHKGHLLNQWVQPMALLSFILFVVMATVTMTITIQMLEATNNWKPTMRYIEYLFL